ncbi:ribonuclease domain-containing protein [Deinococcus aerophilus]|uniref:Ribonuclease n=1 Tax=Deinococcus aerophilus TaxID=522488 RepID=A0ABQ2GV84_9DEIO|nr:ribonuclease domain-containing protein [Deinococcus aerophilus]GGM14989.1 ribonuclease [Deinococcus aerophilus]
MKPPALLYALLATVLAGCDLPSGTQDAQSQPQIQTQRAPDAAEALDPASGLRWMSADALPREGTQVLTAIRKGGPFRYSKDGTTFGNREGLLPQQPGNYYREYTVPTPGEADRGARRIVCGGLPITRADECYYTADHYSSFRRIRP